MLYAQKDISSTFSLLGNISLLDKLIDAASYPLTLLMVNLYL